MEESILKSTKKILGLADNYTPFDLDVITHINAAFSILDQLGVGPEGGFYIEDDVAIWSDYNAPPNQLHLIKTYIFLKVRLLFDPPTTSFLIEATTNQLREYEWRLNTFREWALDPVDPMDEPDIIVDPVMGEEELVYESKGRRVYRAPRRRRNEVGRP